MQHAAADLAAASTREQPPQGAGPEERALMEAVARQVAEQFLEPAWVRDQLAAWGGTLWQDALSGRDPRDIVLDASDVRRRLLDVWDAQRAHLPPQAEGFHEQMRTRILDMPTELRPFPGEDAQAVGILLRRLPVVVLYGPPLISLFLALVLAALSGRRAVRRLAWPVAVVAGLWTAVLAAGRVLLPGTADVIAVRLLPQGDLPQPVREALDPVTLLDALTRALTGLLTTPLLAATVALAAACIILAVPRLRRGAGPEQEVVASEV